MRQRSVPEKLNILISSVMALLYFGGGIFLITSSLSFGYLAAGSLPRMALSAVLIIYGLFRGYRVWRVLQQESSDE